MVFKYLIDTISKSSLTIWVFAFFLLFCVMFCSGRIGNIDAHSQLLASRVFVATGNVGAVIPPGGFEDLNQAESNNNPMPKLLFWQAPNGLYYQTHDIGNPAFMLPIAALWQMAYPTKYDVYATEVPRPIKAITSAYFSIHGALAATALFASFRLSMSEIRSFLYSLLFLITGIYLTYTRMPWDVVGAGAFAMISFYFLLAQINNVGHPIFRAIAIGLSVGVASDFRVSFGPFLLVMIAGGLFPHRNSITKTQFALFCGALILSLAPSFIYNEIRTGNPLHPATIIPRYPTMPTASWKIPDNLWRMFLSFNKGLFIFSPVLLYALIAKTSQERKLLIPVVLGTMGYAIGLASTPQWSAGPCWGPRYLVPLTPIFFYLAVIQINKLSGFWKIVAWNSMICSFLINLPTYLINYQIAINEEPLANDDQLNYPYPQIAVWNGLLAGLAGQEIQIREETRAAISEGNASASTQFPDLLVAHVIRELGRDSFQVLLAFFGLLILVSYCLFKEMRLLKRVDNKLSYVS
jgi:hypothetical protein